ncbi:MAG: hypothetical protein AB1758_36350, partial [Candidatus Eremiobacterota bacterium]
AGRRDGWLWLGAPVAAALASLALPAVRGMLAALVEVRSSTILEHQAVTLSGIGSFYATAAVLAPLAALGLIFRPRPRAVAVVLYGLLLLALWIRTHDFIYLGPPFVALLASLVVAPRLHRPWQYGLAAVALFAPMAWTSPWWPRPDQVATLKVLTEPWVEATGWMREHTPPPSLDLEAPTRNWGPDLNYPPGTYGVFTAWDRGHFVACLARRPVVMSQTESWQIGAWLSLQDEDEALTRLQEGCQDSERVDYVVLGTETAAEGFLTTMEVAGKSRSDFEVPGEQFSFEGENYQLPVYGEAYERSMVYRLLLEEGQGLGHFRLVYQTRAQAFVAYWAALNRANGKMEVIRRSFPITEAEWEKYRAVSGVRGVFPAQGGHFYRGLLVPAVSVYQVVPGARVRGRARPGQEVTARLVLRSGRTGRQWSFHRTAVAGPNGRYELVLPYPTVPDDGSDIQAAGPYSVPGLLLPVSREQVQRGDVIELPEVPAVNR